jgi:hypothetical protein
MRIGLAVLCAPDDELAGFVRCGMTVFRLADERVVAELPKVTIAARDTNGMKFEADGLVVELECGVNADQTEATYEISGREGADLVFDHLGSVRLR